MKILLIRFSSIGDIVITTSVIRMLKKQYPEAEIHYLTKDSFSSILAFNPIIDKLFTLKDSFKELLAELSNEKYDLVFDMHKNLRTKRLLLSLNYKQLISYNKKNIAKWLLVNFKIDRLENHHVLISYQKSLAAKGITQDICNYEFFLDPNLEKSPLMLQLQNSKYSTVVIGAKFATKQLPKAKLIELLKKIKGNVVLLGAGKADEQLADDILKEFTNSMLFNAVGIHSLQQSAWIIKNSNHVYTNDTGLMHIACAFKKPLTLFWGSTSKSFGFAPLQVDSQAKINNIEIALKCRPCSKLGFESCPKKHFDCMNKLDMSKLNYDN